MIRALVFSSEEWSRLQLLITTTKTTLIPFVCAEAYLSNYAIIMVFE